MAQLLMSPGEKTAPIDEIEHEIGDLLEHILNFVQDIPKKIA